MEPIPNEGGHDLSSLFSFSSWRKSVRDPKMRRIELALLFSIGIFLGLLLKDIVGEYLTIGYQDYTIQAPENRIDFNVVERETLAKRSVTSDPAKAGICSNEITTR